MKADENFLGQVRKWLSSQEMYDNLVVFVKKKIDQKSSSAGSSVRYWQEIPLVDLDKDGRKIFYQEATHSFVEFLLRNLSSQLEKNPLLAASILNNQLSEFLTHFWVQYYRVIREEGRNRSKNPLGYLYRRFREVLTKDQSFYTTKDTDNHICYGCHVGLSEQSDTLANFAAEEFADWPQLPFRLKEDSKKEISVDAVWVRNTAKFFWEEAQRRNLGKLISIRDLRNYVATVYPWLKNPKITSLSAENDDGSTLLDILPDPHQKNPVELYEKMCHIDSISTLVAQIIAVLSQEECCVVYWRLMEPPRTFQDIARRLSLKNLNKAYSLNKSAQKKFKSFFSKWPGLSIEDLPEEVAILLIEKIKDSVKNCRLRP